MSDKRKVPSPDEVLAEGPGVPDKILDVVNQLIREQFFASTDSVRILRDDVVNRYILAVQAETPERPAAEIRAEVFSKHWLDFEPIYRAHGWAVQFVQPDWGAVGDSAFIFRKAAQSQR